MVLLVLAACRSRPSGPDEHYQKAQQIFSQLYATQLDDAYGDPQIDTVLAELKQVNPRSIDADAARALQDNIARGRDALAKQRAEREKLGQAAAQSFAVGGGGSSIDPAAVLAASAPDAGPPPDAYNEGADIAKLNSDTGGCLNSYEPFTEQITGVTGTVYRVVPSEGCKAKLPGFVGQAVLVANGKIYRRIPDPQPPLPPKVTILDGGQPPQQAQRGGQPAAQPPPRPVLDDAGQPVYDVVIPGAPQPGVQPAPAPEQTQQ